MLPDVSMSMIHPSLMHSVGVLRTFRLRRLLVNGLLSEVRLSQVRYIHWRNTSLFSRTAPRISLWDRSFDSNLTDHHGLELACVNDGLTAKEARELRKPRELGEFRAADLLAHPLAHRAFLEYFQPLTDAGTVTSAVSLKTLTPLTLG